LADTSGGQGSYTDASSTGQNCGIARRIAALEESQVEVEESDERV